MKYTAMMYKTGYPIFIDRRFQNTGSLSSNDTGIPQFGNILELIH